MSAVNVESVQRGYEAAARGDLEAIRELLAPDVVWHGGDRSAAGACRNRDAALAFMRQAIAGNRLGQLIDVIDAGDRVVVVLQPPPSGDVVPPLRANVTSFREGKVVEMVAYESPEAALTAVGIQAAG